MFELSSLKQMWANAWPIISLLLFSSIISVAIILERWLHLRRAAFDRDQVLGKLRRLLLENRREQALAYAESLDKPVGRVLAVLLESTISHGQISYGALERLSDRLIRTENAGMTRYITGLGTIGSTAPFVGLFGTVVGIIHAFRAISENAGGGPGVVANGIAEALITTALGLFVAIPAVICYNLFMRKIERIVEDMELCVEEVVDAVTADRAPAPPRPPASVRQ
jgi:biopolymer transport protein ExbB/biopolymer transport protein TolQ